jgi:predicted dehydrogenase
MRRIRRAAEKGNIHLMTWMMDNQRPIAVTAVSTSSRPCTRTYGERGLAIATGGSGLRIALPNEPEHTVTPPPRAADERDPISHLIAVVRGTRQPNALSSLENNLIATEILEAARESARTGKRVLLGRNAH